MARALTRFAPPRRPRWRLEHLEDRSVPAGNVSAELAGNTLTLIGDDLGNSVRLLPASGPNAVIVQGVGTTVNGSAAPQVFTGVENFVAHLLDGDDSLVFDGVTLVTAGTFFFVDGNAGDDHIELADTSIDAFVALDLQIYGERVIGGFASGTTGNDTIRLTGTRLTSQFFTTVKIYGETNDGGEVTGGNDEITIADSEIAARGGFFLGVQVDIVGDANVSRGGQTATIGGGNDRISVTDTTIASANDLGTFQNIVNVTIIGDFNDVSAVDPATFTGKDAAGLIGGGNDDITVAGTDISIGGVNFVHSQTAVMIVGDRNFVSGFLPENTTAATIGGGNDRITVAGSTVSTTGGPSNGTFVEIRGEDIQVAGPDGASTTSTIGGGNDRIAVTDTAVIADGPSGDAAALVIHGEHTVAFASGVSNVGGGNDVVTLRAVTLPGHPVDDFVGFIIDTGSGHDRLEITDSAARFYFVNLGDGDDRLTFTNNFIGTEASLEGGPGFDRITAHGNTGPGALIWFGFEDEDVTT